MPTLLRIDPHRERLYRSHILPFVSPAAPYDTPWEETAHVETRALRRALLLIRCPALSASDPTAFSAAASDAVSPHGAAGSWRRRRRYRPCVTRLRRSSLLSLSPYSTGPPFELFPASRIRYIGDFRPKHARSSASFFFSPPPASPSSAPSPSLSFSSFFSGSSSSPPPLSPPPPPPPPPPSPHRCLPIRTKISEKKPPPSPIIVGAIERP